MGNRFLAWLLAQAAIDEAARIFTLAYRKSA